MARQILKRLEASLGNYESVRLSDWNEVERLVHRLPEKTNLVIPKSSLASACPHPRSRLGRSRGALRQYRDERVERSLHVKEYEAHWVVHADAWNPHRRPFRHLWVDHGYSTFLHLAHVLSAPAPEPVPAPVNA